MTSESMRLSALRSRVARRRAQMEAQPPMTPEETRAVMAAMKQINDDLAPFRSEVNRRFLGEE